MNTPLTDHKPVGIKPSVAVANIRASIRRLMPKNVKIHPSMRSTVLADALPTVSIGENGYWYFRLQTTIAQLMQQQKEIDALKSELKQQRASIQKVSDKVEMKQPA